MTLSTTHGTGKIDETEVLHWYDYICPYCYIGQSRNAILRKRGYRVIEIPFQAHPDIPASGIPARPRTGLMYTKLEWEAKKAGLILKWPSHLPNTRVALSASEWVRRHQPALFAQFHKDLFSTHFVLNEDLGDPAVVERHALELGIDIEGLREALLNGTAQAAVEEAESLGRRRGVIGTPAWLIGEKLVSGLLPSEGFGRLTDAADIQRLP